jgi:hypothetical protein
MTSHPGSPSGGVIGPMAFSSRAGSAAVVSSPYAAKGLSPSPAGVVVSPPPSVVVGSAPWVVVASSPAVVVVSPPSSAHAARMSASTAIRLMTLVRFISSSNWTVSPSFSFSYCWLILSNLLSQPAIQPVVFSRSRRRCLRRSRSSCSTPLMMRSPETSIPPMMTTPNTTNWSAVGSPMTRII